MKFIRLACFILLSVDLSAGGQTNQIFIHADQVIKTSSPLMTGACLEDVNHEIYGGLYSQMIFGESFQEEPMQVYAEGLSGQLSCKAPGTELVNESTIRSWQPVKTGNVIGTFGINKTDPFVGNQSQQISFISGIGAIGIENRGLNREGLYISGQKPYEGEIYVKAGKQTQLYISLENADGSLTYSQTIITVNAAHWKKYDFKLTPSKTSSNSRLSITLRKPGSVNLGYVFLQPGAWGRYKNLPLRKDVIEGLLKEKVTVLRYGGSMTLSNSYRWKNMIGPREKRPPYKNVWYPYESNGWGIIDFMNMCEAMHIAAIPDFDSNETPADLADFIEYENGGPNTKWGKKRIADGHLSPYHLKYLELGNEQYNNDTLTMRFKLLSDAIWAKDPSIRIIYCLSDNTREDVSGDIKYLKQTIQHCRQNGHQAWFDVHVWNNEASEPDLKDFVFAEEKLKSVASDKDFKLCIFEENADNARMKRGLAHANAINRLQRLKYDVPIVCAANCLQVDKQNDNGWDQGLLFFNPEFFWGQPSYYVTQMIADNYLPVTIQSEFTSKTGSLDITARKSRDGKIISLQVVNYKSKLVNAHVILDDFNKSTKKIDVITLKGNSLDDWNTAEKQDAIIPVKSEINAKDTKRNYIFAPYSFTIINFKL
jgi:alpha-L-arabinofuranosidase